LRILERSVQLIECQAIRAVDVDLDLVFGLAGRPEDRYDDEFRCQQIFSSVLVIDLRVTIVISLVNCRATDAVGSSDAGQTVAASNNSHE